MNDLRGVHIHIDGIVQGVGFRPFVYGLATRMAITGWVRNTSAGVEIQVCGTDGALNRFVESLQREVPPLARIDRLEVTPSSADHYSTFEIIASEPVPGAFQPISPDVGICADCLRELFDPADRRYRYPFINCTNCGPRFTIIRDIPYDRPSTTMAAFQMCPDCAAEYDDPLDRRFHAQPVACPACGPQVWLENLSETTGDYSGDAAILEAQRLLAQGKIVAVKGLGGFHLACDATNPTAVAELRRRKLRVDKPFALMMPDIAAIEEHCLLDDRERSILELHQRPIVILRRKPGSTLALEVAPGQSMVGVMLPYTPLHYLLFSHPGPDPTSVFPLPPGSYPQKSLVMTSGNLSEEPIATSNEEARHNLRELADAFLMHDRLIHVRCDDSVVRVVQDSRDFEQAQSESKAAGSSSQVYFLRRSRGYAPSPVCLPWSMPPLLATGAELKNSFCLARDHYAFLSHHIGDLENYETLRSFEDGIAHYERLYHVRPQILAYDLHPNYLATRYALERAGREHLTAIGVQHHHAHIAASMAEHGLSGEQPVIGVSFDGTGYGDDGQIWGGEFLLANYTGYQRFAHLAYFPLPGGDAAVRKPARAALAFLHHAGIEWDPHLPSVLALGVEERIALRAQLESRINTPLTSSMGRLFDIVAALAGVRQKVNYEAQAAIELEALVDPGEAAAYSFGWSCEERGADCSAPVSDAGQKPLARKIDPAPVIQAILGDLESGTPVSSIAARFHNGVASMVLEGCRSARVQFGIDGVVLSGGVWQNMALLYRTISLLREAGFTVYIHHQVPANDGGLALGQAVIAAHITSNGGSHVLRRTWKNH